MAHAKHIEIETENERERERQREREINKLQLTHKTESAISNVQHTSRRHTQLCTAHFSQITDTLGQWIVHTLHTLFQPMSLILIHRQLERNSITEIMKWFDSSYHSVRWCGKWKYAMHTLHIRSISAMIFDNRKKNSTILPCQIDTIRLQRKKDFSNKFDVP